MYLFKKLSRFPKRYEFYNGYNLPGLREKIVIVQVGSYLFAQQEESGYDMNLTNGGLPMYVHRFKSN